MGRGCQGEKFGKPTATARLDRRQGAHVTTDATGGNDTIGWLDHTRVLSCGYLQFPLSTQFESSSQLTVVTRLSVMNPIPAYRFFALSCFNLTRDR